jgi:hypothetical protein
VKVVIAFVIAGCLLVVAAIVAASTRRFEGWDIYLVAHRHCNCAGAVTRSPTVPPWCRPRCLSTFIKAWRRGDSRPSHPRSAAEFLARAASVTSTMRGLRTARFAGLRALTMRFRSGIFLARAPHIH